MATPSDFPVKSFASPAAWRAWLEKQHAKAPGLWVRLFKKAADPTAMTYAQALDEALCFGWIDGQKQICDERSWLQRFTPRRARSKWSQTNIGHVARLIKEKKMMPAGHAQIEAAKKDGRWDSAYQPASKMEIPKDFLAALSKSKTSEAFFATLNKANLYAIAYRLQTAKKPETRERRMQQILQMMKEGKKFH